MLILTPNPQPKPYTSPFPYCWAFLPVCHLASAKDTLFVLQFKNGESKGKSAKTDRGRPEKKKQRKCEAAWESSNVNFPWTFLGVTIKPLVLLKLDSKTCDWIIEEEGEAGAQRQEGEKAKLKQQTNAYINRAYSVNKKDVYIKNRLGEKTHSNANKTLF